MIFWRHKISYTLSKAWNRHNFLISNALLEKLLGTLPTGWELSVGTTAQRVATPFRPLLAHDWHICSGCTLKAIFFTIGCLIINVYLNARVMIPKFTSWENQIMERLVQTRQSWEVGLTRARIDEETRNGKTDAKNKIIIYLSIIQLLVTIDEKDQCILFVKHCSKELSLN